MEEWIGMDGDAEQRWDARKHDDAAGEKAVLAGYGYGGRNYWVVGCTIKFNAVRNSRMFQGMVRLYLERTSA